MEIRNNGPLELPQFPYKLVPVSHTCVFRVPVGGKLVAMCEMNANPMRLEQNRADSR
jgi:hypothetical protein